MRPVCAVRGDLLRWAREQQNLSFRDIEARGGPSRSYLSEVERGKKREVSSSVLDRLVRVLNVTEPFARGQLVKYKDGNHSVAGLASEIGRLVTSGGAPRRDWAVLTVEERVRKVLQLIAHESRHFSRVVLAWILDLDVRLLNGVLEGEHPIMRQHMEAAAALTLMPESLFTHGTSPAYETYLPVFHRALELGISPQQLLSLIEAETSLQRTGLRRIGQPIT